MKRLLLIMVAPVLLWGQYWDQRSLEKSFEESDIYFNSFYLNPYGIHQFNNVMPGLVKDPFLSIWLNPASIVDLDTNNLLIYADMRGDRTESAIVRDYGLNYGTYDYYSPLIYYNPQWAVETRSEPQPFLTLALIGRPFPLSLSRLQFAAEFQLIRKNEQFYSLPAWIYYGAKNAEYDDINDIDIPVIDRASGEDEMFTRGFKYTFTAAWKFSPRFSTGLSFSGVTHSREGNYLNATRGEYFPQNEYINSYYYYQEKNSDYHHSDLAGGIQFAPDSSVQLGLKVGYLAGKTDQNFQYRDSSFYYYENRENTQNFYRSLYCSHTDQIWQHDGHSEYLSINYSNQFRPDMYLRAFYTYRQISRDLTNHSTILDTSFYQGSWEYNLHSSDYLSWSKTHDIRQGDGTKKQNLHQVMISLNRQLSAKATLSVGLYYSYSLTKINMMEPVQSSQASYYFNRYYNDYEEKKDSSTYQSQLTEDKKLEWQYQSNCWEYQLPIILSFQITKNYRLDLGLNKSLKEWKIEDQTTAWYTFRERIENRKITRTEQFGERYREPTRNMTDEHTDLFANFEIAITPQFKVNALFEPDLNNEFRIAQWWLGFRIYL